MIRDDVDGILIDSEEDGFHLIVSGLEAEYNFRLGQDGAITLMRAVDTEIRPWWAEGQAVLAEMKAHGAFRCDPDESGGLDEPYDWNDPKHPDHHSIHADLYDNREGK